MSSVAQVSVRPVEMRGGYQNLYIDQISHSIADRLDSLTASISFGVNSLGARVVRQRGAHITIGQFSTSVHTEFGFQLGEPSVRPVWRGGVPEWISRVINLCDRSCEDAALKEISLVTARFKADKEFLKLSSDLGKIDIRGLPDVVLVALLRNTFSVRSQVSCWDSLMGKVENLLTERNRNPARLLRGLKSHL